MKLIILAVLILAFTMTAKKEEVEPPKVVKPTIDFVPDPDNIDPIDDI